MAVWQRAMHRKHAWSLFCRLRHLAWGHVALTGYTRPACPRSACRCSSVTCFVLDTVLAGGPGARIVTHMLSYEWACAHMLVSGMCRHCRRAAMRWEAMRRAEAWWTHSQLRHTRLRMHENSTIQTHSGKEASQHKRKGASMQCQGGFGAVSQRKFGHPLPVPLSQ